MCGSGPACCDAVLSVKPCLRPRSMLAVLDVHPELAGFIIVCAAMRLLADKGYCVERGIRYFKEQRPPGIYKNDYITDLFT